MESLDLPEDGLPDYRYLLWFPPTSTANGLNVRFTFVFPSKVRYSPSSTMKILITIIWYDNPVTSQIVINNVNDSDEDIFAQLYHPDGSPILLL